MDTPCVVSPLPALASRCYTGRNAAHVFSGILPTHRAGAAFGTALTRPIAKSYTLVNHTLSRALDKGAVAQIRRGGSVNPAIFDVPAGQQMAEH
jgi:hypothetical protein